MKLPAKQVEDICKNLPSLTKTAIRRLVNEDSESYTPGSSLCFWLADMLATVKIASTEQIRAIVEEYVGLIQEYGLDIAKSLEEQSKKVRAYRVAILDRRYACIETSGSFLDLQDGNIVTTLPKLPLETVAYDLNALYIFYKKKLPTSN